MNLSRLGKTYEQWDLQNGLARSNNDILAHIMSELGEAFECIREGDIELNHDETKPEGLGPELADIIILAAKLAAYNGIDIEKMIELKHNYNTTRIPGNKEYK